MRDGNALQTPILAEVERYYTGRVREHGASPRGVDWNGVDGQIMRFRQLEKLFAGEGALSINDIGCGYGALYSFLEGRYHELDYHGCDISLAMIEAAREALGDRSNATFAVEAEPARQADFGVASGIFNVRLDRTAQEWSDYVFAMLDAIDRTSRRGFAFNCLTSYSDADRMRDDLFYADPLALFDACKRRYARDVALLHDYGLYEFTILVRKVL